MNAVRMLLTAVALSLPGQVPAAGGFSPDDAVKMPQERGVRQPRDPAQKAPSDPGAIVVPPKVDPEAIETPPKNVDPEIATPPPPVSGTTDQLPSKRKQPGSGPADAAPTAR